jgi:hypothetical protein
MVHALNNTILSLKFFPPKVCGAKAIKIKSGRGRKKRASAIIAIRADMAQPIQLAWHISTLYQKRHRKSNGKDSLKYRKILTKMAKKGPKRLPQSNWEVDYENTGRSICCSALVQTTHFTSTSIDE